MKALYALCLSLAAFAFARPAQAELEYLVYDLSTGHTETVTNPDVTAEVYHTGSKMLFVRDPKVADQTYYIGVFEVTRAQAATLKWTGVPENNHDGWAYGTTTEGNFATAVKPLPKNLAFPSHVQWKAYTDDPATLTKEDEEDINIRGGASPTYRNISLVDWYNNHLCASPSQLLPNSHGVYDIYGNVAEYATGGKGEGPFYGGAAASADSFSHLNEGSKDNLRNQGKSASRYNENVCGARLVYMPPKEQFYSVTVTLDDADVTEATVTVPEGMTPAELKVGTSVTVSAPTPAEWHRLSGRTVTQGNLTFTEAVDAPITFNMPTSNVVIAYTSEPYGTITVEGGTAKVTHGEETVTAGKNTQVVVGDTVTLDADEAGSYQFFVQWNGADGDTLTVDENLMGKETVIEAVYQYYPRVIVVGGTATVAEADAEKSFGNGYYAMGTVLTLEAQELPGYKFTAWTVSSESEVTGSLDTERNTYTIGANDAGTTVTLTATYAYDESGESGTVTPADIHLGSTLDEGVYTAHPLFGWTPRSSETTVTDETSNRYHVYPYVAAGLYANLDLTTGKVVYSDSLSQGETTGGSSMPSPPQLWQFDGDIEAYEKAFEAWKKEWDEWAKTHGSGTFNAKQLPLRRVIPTDGAAEFYLGVYETAMGHVENLKALREGKEPSSSDAAAYCGKHGGDEVCENWPSAFNTLRNNLNDTFFGGATRVRYPTQDDLFRVAQTSVTTENPDAGKGYPADTNLTEAMVVGGGTTAKPSDVNVMTPCYGFYGLWGNGWETAENGDGFAGSAFYSHTLDERGVFLTEAIEPLPSFGVQSFATFRPAIDVEEAVVIYVGEKNSAKAVQVAPGQPLFADPSVLPTKALFRCTGWTLGETKIKAGDNHAVKPEDNEQVLVPTWEETPTSVTVKCENCLGPETAYPGQTVTVYPLEGMAFAAENPLAVAPDDGSVTVTPAEDGTLTVTFPETLPLDTEITLTGTLVPIEEPEPEVKPGYRFRLR